MINLVMQFRASLNYPKILSSPFKFYSSTYAARVQNLILFSIVDCLFIVKIYLTWEETWETSTMLQRKRDGSEDGILFHLFYLCSNTEVDRIVSYLSFCKYKRKTWEGKSLKIM